MRRWTWFVALAMTGLALATPARADDKDICAKQSGDIAIAACTRAIQSGRYRGLSLAPIYYNRGLEYKRKNDLDRAMADYNEALRLNPRDPSAYINRGNVFSIRGDRERAIADYDQAIRFDAKSAIAHNNRGNQYRRKGEIDRSIPDYEAAIRLDPKYASPHVGLGLAYEKKGDPDRAMAEYNTALRLNPQDATAYVNRGNIYSNRGDRDRAIADYDQAIRIDPKDAIAYYNRGNEYKRKGELQRALADYERASQFDPGDKDAIAAIERTRQAIASAAPSAPAARPAAPPPVPAVVPTPNFGAPATLHTGRRVALVIGNGAYTTASALPNPPNDARDIAAALRDIGFEVIEGYDLDGTAMRRKIGDFSARIQGAATTLFFYAGHGMQVAGKNYLIPIDARLERPSSLGIEAIEIGLVLSDMESEKRTNLVFLDACRDNPLSRSLARSFGTRSTTVGQGLAQLNAGIGTLIAFATSPDTVALDGSGRNSPFTQALLKHIRTPHLEVRSMLTRVRADVLSLTNDRQVPWDHSSLTGEFYFVQ